MNRKRQSTLARVMNEIALALLSVCVFSVVGSVVSVASATLFEQFFGTSEFSQGRAGGIFLAGFFLLGLIMLVFTIPAGGFTSLIWLPLWWSGDSHPVFRRKGLAVLVGAFGGLVVWLCWLGYWYFISGNPEFAGGHRSPDPRTWSDSILLGSLVGPVAAGALVFLLTTFFADKEGRGRVLMEIPPRVVAVGGNAAKKSPAIPPSPPKAIPASLPKKAPPPDKGRPKKKPSWTDWGETKHPPE